MEQRYKQEQGSGDEHHDQSRASNTYDNPKSSDDVSNEKDIGKNRADANGDTGNDNKAKPTMRTTTAGMPPSSKLQGIHP